MGAPKGNSNASNGLGNGVQVNFYLNAEDAEAIRRKLLGMGRDASKKAVLAYAREQSKNGIWLAVRDELPPIIL